MIKKYLHFNLVLILLAFCLATTIIAQNAPSSLIDNGNSTVLATVGDIEITEDEFISGYEYGPSFYKRSAESKRKYIQYLINEKLLALKGYDEKIDTTEQVDEMYKEIINDLATEELFKEDILKPIQATDSELDSVVTQKQIEIEMRWLYAEEFKEIHNYLNLLQNNISFDSLYAKQFSDSVSVDMRSLKTTRYLLGQKNPVLAKLIDTLRIGTYSSPIYSDEGWYIIKLNNVWNAILTNETELHKLKYESRQAIVKNKMDKASDLYVHNLLTAADPTIKRESFTIVRSFIGQYALSKETFLEWDLDRKMDSVLAKNTNEDIGNKSLVIYSGGELSIDKYLRWYRNRIQYLKFNKSSLASFSISIEQSIWQMVRDELLTNLALQRGMFSKPEVLKQSRWWKDKIVFSAVMNQIKSSIDLNAEEMNLNDGNNSQSEIDRINQETTKRIFRELQHLKKKYKVELKEKLLQEVQVTSENDPKAIDLYTVKKGGLIPRTPFPIIDNFWQYWE